MIANGEIYIFFFFSKLAPCADIWMRFKGEHWTEKNRNKHECWRVERISRGIKIIFIVRSYLEIKYRWINLNGRWNKKKFSYFVLFAVSFRLPLTREPALSAGAEFVSNAHEHNSRKNVHAYCAYAPCYKFTMYKSALNILPIFRLHCILQRVGSELRHGKYLSSILWNVPCEHTTRMRERKGHQQVYVLEVISYEWIISSAASAMVDHFAHHPEHQVAASRSTTVNEADEMMEHNSDGSIRWMNLIQCEFRSFSIIRPPEWKMIIMAFIIRLNRAANARCIREHPNCCSNLCNLPKH